MSGFLSDARMAWMNLLEHRQRMLFLAGAIVAVTSSFVLLSAVSAGIRRTLIETSTTLSTGHLNVGGFYKVTPAQAVPVVTEYARVIEVVTAALPKLAFAVHRGRGWVKIVSDRGSLQRGLGGVDIESEPGLKRVLQIRSGNLEHLAQPNALLIFESQAEKLHLSVGDVVTLSAQTTRGAVNTLDCRVVAIAREIGLLSQWNVFVSNSSLRTLYQWQDDVTGVVMIYLAQSELRALGEVAERLRHALEHAGYRLMPTDPRPFWMKIDAVSQEDWTGQKLDVTTWEDELSFMTWTVRAVRGLSTMLFVILIAIVITGIMNTLWIAVRERTREIGTLRAIGMQRGEVVRLFLLEAVMLSAVGATVGIALGVVGVAALNAAQIHVPSSVQLVLMRDTLQLVIEPGLLGLILALLIVLTCVAAIHPSLRAAQRKPVDAMAHFG